jgi:hypothetical protein
MTSSEADMVGVKMTIIGDPDYIKQDDIFYGADASQLQKVGSETDVRILPDGGSLVMDDSGLYVQVLFKVPKDIDDKTGFMKYDAGQRNSVFSGLYQVISVTSTFVNGKFTQQLDLTRLPRQVAFDYVGNSNSNNQSNARPESDNVSAKPIELVPEPPTTSTAEAADTATDQIAGQDQPAGSTNTAAEDSADRATPSALQQDLAVVAQLFFAALADSVEHVVQAGRIKRLAAELTHAHPPHLLLGEGPLLGELLLLAQQSFEHRRLISEAD